MRQHFYFAACAADGGIYHYIWGNDRLRFADRTVCDRPMYLDVRNGSVQAVLRAPFEKMGADSEAASSEEMAAGKGCKAVSIEKMGAGANRKNSGLVEYAINEDGSLNPAGVVTDTGGVVGCHLCRWRGHTYVANYLSGSVFSSAGIVRSHAGRGPHPTRQEAPHLHFIQPSPDGRCLLAVDLGTDSIYSYDEELRLIGTAHVPSGCGPRHLAYSEDGRTVFCVNELASSVSVFAYEDCRLTLLQTVRVLERENPENTAAAIRVDGRYVYVSNRGEDAISCLEWDGSRLRLRSVTACGGSSPRDFLLAEGRLFCTNERSNNVTVFSVDGPILKKEEEELVLPSPLCVAAVLRPQTG